MCWPKTDFDMKYSLKVVHFAISYRPIIGCISLYAIVYACHICAVFEDVATEIAEKNPKSRLMPPPSSNSANICMSVIFPETRLIGLHFCRWLYGSIFIQICAMGSKRRKFAAIVLVENGFLTASIHSRSFKVIHFVAICRPTSVSISLYNIAGLISEDSEEVSTQMAKNCRIWQTHSHLTPLARGTPRKYPHKPYISRH